MKIISIHVDSFGKLKNFKLEAESLTEVLGENGYGKTTLAAFIKAMLYGLPDNRDKSKLRKKYAPWSGGDFGGTMDIETERGKFRIARRFSPSTGDSFELTSLNTGLPSDEYSENIGEELFGINSESYDKCTYMPQSAAELKELKMTDSISARQTALVEGSSDMGNFSDAVEKIKKKRSRLVPYNGTDGLIEDTKNALAECEKSIRECEKKLTEAASLRNGIVEIESRIAEIRSDIKLLGERIETENKRMLVRKDHETYEGLVKDANDCEIRLNAVKDDFKNGIPTDEELRTAETLESEINVGVRDLDRQTDTGNAELELLANRFAGGTPSSFELTSRILDAKDIKTKKIDADGLRATLTPPPEPKEPSLKDDIKGGMLTAGIGLAVLGLILAAVGFALIFPMAIVGIVALVAGAATAAYAFAAKGKAEREAELRFRDYEAAKNDYDGKVRALQSLEEKIKQTEDALTAFLLGYGVKASGDAETDLRTLSNDAERYGRLALAAGERKSSELEKREEIGKNMTALASFREKYGFAPSQSIPDIRQRRAELLRLEGELAERRKKAEDFKNEKQLADLPPESDIDLGKLKAASNKAIDEQNRLVAEQSRMSERADSLETEAESLAAIKESREELNARVSEYTERRDVYDKTIKYLESAKENLSSRYLVNMQNSFEGRFNALTGNECDVTLNAKLEVKLREESGAQKADAYSTGWQAVTAICIRLSLIDSLYGEERPFLVLDDPFVNLDGEKLERAKEMLRELSRDTQIIYLTCHESRSLK